MLKKELGIVQQKLHTKVKEITQLRQILSTEKQVCFTHHHHQAISLVYFAITGTGHAVALKAAPNSRRRTGAAYLGLVAVVVSGASFFSRSRGLQAFSLPFFVRLRDVLAYYFSKILS